MKTVLDRLSPRGATADAVRRSATTLMQLRIGERLRSRIIPATARGTEVSTTATQIPRYAEEGKCFAAYLKRLAHQ